MCNLTWSQYWLLLANGRHSLHSFPLFPKSMHLPVLSLMPPKYQQCSDLFCFFYCCEPCPNSNLLFSGLCHARFHSLLKYEPVYFTSILKILQWFPYITGKKIQVLKLVPVSLNPHRCLSVIHILFHEHPIRLCKVSVSWLWTSESTPSVISPSLE